MVKYRQTIIKCVLIEIRATIADKIEILFDSLATETMNFNKRRSANAHIHAAAKQAHLMSVATTLPA